MKKIKLLLMSTALFLSLGVGVAAQNNEVEAASKYCSRTARTITCRNTKSTTNWTQQTKTIYSSSNKIKKNRTQVQTVYRTKSKRVTQEQYTWYHKGGTKIKEQKTYSERVKINGKWVYTSFEHYRLKSTGNSLDPFDYTYLYAYAKYPNGKVALTLYKDGQYSPVAMKYFEEDGTHVATYEITRDDFKVVWEKYPSVDEEDAEALLDNLQ